MPKPANQGVQYYLRLTGRCITASLEL